MHEWEETDALSAEISEALFAAVWAQRNLALAAAGVPLRYQRAFSEPAKGWPRPSNARTYAVKTWRGNPWAITLHGPVGSGKSFYAAELLFRNLKAAARDDFDREYLNYHGEWVKRTEPPVTLDGQRRWITAAEIVTLTFDRKRAEDLADLQAVRWLVIDDLGRGHEGEAQWSAVARFLYARYDCEMPTIATTNLTAEALLNQDAGLCDRLAEGLMVPVAGESRRETRLAAPEHLCSRVEDVVRFAIVEDIRELAGDDAAAAAREKVGATYSIDLLRAYWAELRSTHGRPERAA